MSEKQEKAKEELEDLVISNLELAGLQLGKLYSIGELEEFSMKFNDTKDRFNGDVIDDMNILYNATKRVGHFIKIEPKGKRG